MGNTLRKTSLFMVFMEGILFLFALGKNPVREYERKLRSRSDAESMAQDWRNVGNDLRKCLGTH